MLSVTPVSNYNRTIRYQRYNKLMLGMTRDERMKDVWRCDSQRTSRPSGRVVVNAKSISGILLTMPSMFTIIWGNSSLRRQGRGGSKGRCSGVRICFGALRTAARVGYTHPALYHSALP